MDTILFDLDGTLLPMDMPAFIRLYMDALAQKCAEHGLAPKQVIDAVWAGTRAMISNDGGEPNERRFWRVFSAEAGCDAAELKPVLEAFYEREFHAARAGTRANPAAAPLVRALARSGRTVVLATNPLFPMCAVRTRLSWLGLLAEDFHHITCYENSSRCKPNPAYYAEILRAVDRRPGDCLMVGNDLVEDACAAELGMSFFLVTTDMLNAEGRDLSCWPRGDFAELCAYAQTVFGIRL